jgi:hypothetical protein
VTRLALSVLLAAGAIAATAFAAGSGTVTIAADPGIVRWPNAATLAGLVSSGKAGELVNVEAKECPSRSFRTATWARTTAGGAWVAEAGVQTKTVLRARWRGVLSRNVVVLVRPHLVLGQISRQRFRVQLLLGNAANGKRLLLQRFESDNRVWSPVRTIVFRNSGSAGWPQMTFSATVPKGTVLRLTLPRAEARPCYLAGYSNLIRT